VDTLSPLDKAGAYGIQDKEFNLVNHIEGSYTNIVGLPVDELKEELDSYNLSYDKSDYFCKKALIMLEKIKQPK
jgi:predicted house-cleaning NTP pyrophosphatase (Maf/HAM1 superfamily)